MITKRERKTNELTSDYRESLLKRIKDPRRAIYYLNAALEDTEEPKVFLMALRDVAEAHGMGRTARRAGLNRESFYRMLSRNGNPKISSLFSLLDALGIMIRLDMKDKRGGTLKRAA